MKKIGLKTLLICSLVVFTYHHSLADDDDPETSEFSNPAQAAHAANLSEVASAALDGDVENAENDLVEAEDTRDDAQNTLDNLPPDTSDQVMAEAEAALETAEADLKNAETALDEAVSELAGVSVDAIGDMRSNGYGWGQIAHELGVHPGVLGLGHMKHFTADIATNLPAPELEIAEATKRDVKHGWAKGHGMSTSVASSSRKGLGLAETDLGIGGKGAKSSHGNMGNKGSSANSSRGGSKDDRGAAGGPSNDKSNSGNSSSGKSKSDRGKSGGPSNDKTNNGNNGNDKGNGGDKGNKGGNSGKSK